MSDNLPERVQILGHTHILCITVWENRINCCQIFCNLLLKSAFEQIFNVMQVILVKIKWHIKWKCLITKFHNICLLYYFNIQRAVFQLYSGRGGSTWIATIYCHWKIICCQIFCDLLLKSAFEQIFNVVQLILIKIKWHMKWKYLIQKFRDICLSYYFKVILNLIFSKKLNKTF